MPPYVAYLVFGYVLDSIGDIAPNASIKVTTSIGNTTFTSDSTGLFLFDLAEIGYVSGETVKVSTIGPYNNELLDFTFVVEGFWREADITLALRTLAVDITGYSPPTILHSVGHKPITKENPLPNELVSSVDIAHGMKVDSDNAAYVKLIGSDGNPIKSVQQEENRLGSELVADVLTLVNTLESGNPVSVWVDLQLISSADYTVIHKSADSTIEFTGISPVGSQAIKVIYYV